jgi:hypothetical protein
MVFGSCVLTIAFPKRRDFRPQIGFVSWEKGLAGGTNTVYPFRTLPDYPAIDRMIHGPAGISGQCPLLLVKTRYREKVVYADREKGYGFSRIEPKTHVMENQ